MGYRSLINSLLYNSTKFLKNIFFTPFFLSFSLQPLTSMLAHLVEHVFCIRAESLLQPPGFSFSLDILLHAVLFVSPSFPVSFKLSHKRNKAVKPTIVLKKREFLLSGKQFGRVVLKKNGSGNAEGRYIGLF